MGVALAIHPSDLLAPLSSEVEDRLTAFLDSEARRWGDVDPWLAEPFARLRTFVLRGGKRLRPAFCLSGVMGAGGDPACPAAVDAAASLELLHAFALVHDDVMDGSTLRRGHPALHVEVAGEHRESCLRGDARRFGDGLAVLIGDLAFACADRLMPTWLDLVKDVWDELRSELVMGQYLDVVGAARGGVGEPRAVLITALKSASYTVERPLHLGAAVAGRLPELASWYSEFARPLGEAFQMRDDLLGAFGDEGAIGKPVGDDLAEGKPTVLLAVARQRTRGRAAALLERVGAPDLTAAEVEAIRGVLVECGARDEVERLVDARYAAALRALEDAPIAAPGRHALEVLAGCTLGRAA
ncbi:MAG TPA: polyprenyl synthetase family protein [Acidimicrobiales bacterium]|nr:polyprenyl synthetase family protein [Acidimicrobiales bacterium]